MSSNAATAVRARAHAKINLNLRVLGRRPDGYHDLRTVFQALALHDTLTFTARPGPFAIECSDPHVPVDSENLVWRAAESLRKHACGSMPLQDVSVRIEKRIPIKAGLGGGSADAAAALVGLARLWRLDLPAEELDALGRRLGADVAFFFTGGAALGVGRGDEITPLPDLPPIGVLLVLPPFDVSTADAYGWWDERGNSEPSGLRTTAQKIPGCPWPSPDCDVANDFEPVVAARHPEIGHLVEAIVAAGASAAAMTGSGSTLFGLFDGGEDEAARAARTLLAAGHRALWTRTLSRREYAVEGAPACL